MYIPLHPPAANPHPENNETDADHRDHDDEEIFVYRYQPKPSMIYNEDVSIRWYIEDN